MEPSKSNLSLIIQINQVEFLESVSHSCYFECIFQDKSKKSKIFDHSSYSSFSDKLSFNSPSFLNNASMPINLKLRESQNNKKIAQNQLDLHYLHLPYQEWIPLTNKLGLEARVLINIHFEQIETLESDSIILNISQPKRNFKKYLQKWLINLLENIIAENYPMVPSLVWGRATSWIETPISHLKFEQYRSKLYMIGDDINPVIISFDFNTEVFQKLVVPENLRLMGYSMSVGIPNGNIIITGGINSGLNVIVPSVFCYDPIRNKVRVLAPMQQPRYTHTICYHDGFVYVIGGRYYGQNAAGVLAKCEKYNLINNTWSIISDLKNKRCTACATVYQKQIYVFGGYQGTSRIKSIEKYNEQENEWTNLEFTLRVPVEAGIIYPISNDEFIYIGGQDDLSINSDISIYNLTSQTKLKKINMNKGRVLALSGQNKEKIFIFGGCNFEYECIDINTWEVKPSKSFSDIIENDLKTFSCATSSDYFEEEKIDSFGDELVFIGNEQYNFIIKYSKLTNKWEQKTPPNNMRLLIESGITTLSNGYIIIAGGKTNINSLCLKFSYLYNHMTNSMFNISPMLNAKYSHSLIEYRGFVYSIGGFLNQEKLTNLCERYNIKANRWEEIESLIENRANPSLFIIKNELFCFGGINNETNLYTIEKYQFYEDFWRLLKIKIPLQTKFFSFLQNQEFIYLFSKDLQIRYLFNSNQNNFEKIETPSITPQNTFSHLFFHEKEIPELLVFGGKNTPSNLTIISPLITEKISIQPIENANLYYDNLKLVPTKQKNSFFGFIDEIKYTNESEKETKIFIFLPETKMNNILEFNLKTENFDSHSIISESPIFFRFSACVGIPDSRIIMTGGLHNSQLGVSVVNSVFVFNIFSKFVKSLTNMMYCRFQHTCITTGKYIYVFGGKKFYSNSKDDILNSVERYNIREDKWETIINMPIGVFNASSCLLNENIYIIGGNDGLGQVDLIQIYDINKTNWSKINILPQKIESPGVLSINYREIIICGGYSKDFSVNTVYAFDVFRKTIDVLSPMLHNRKNPKIASISDYIYILGGNSIFSCERSLCTIKSNKLNLQWEIISNYSHILADDLSDFSYGISRLDLNSFKPNPYKLTNNPNQLMFDKLYIIGCEKFPFVLRLSLPTFQWEKLPSPENLKLWDYSLSVTLPNGNIMITGGINNALNSIKNTCFLLKIDSETGILQSEELNKLNQARYTHTICYLNNFVYVMGGRFFGSGQNGVLTHCERYSLVNKTWNTIAELNLKSCTAVSIAFNNKIYIFGGYRGDGRNKHIERYNELGNKWEFFALNLNQPIEAEVILPISNNEFVFIGGKDDFSEQNYVTVYDLEKFTHREEKNLGFSRILCKCARFNDIIIIVGGNLNKSCEWTKIGDWNWNSFPSYDQLIDETQIDKPNLVKLSYSQSY